MKIIKNEIPTFGKKLHAFLRACIRDGFNPLTMEFVMEHQLNQLKAYNAPKHEIRDQVRERMKQEEGSAVREDAP
jgi:hypothetical protein